FAADSRARAASDPAAFRRVRATSRLLAEVEKRLFSQRAARLRECSRFAAYLRRQRKPHLAQDRMQQFALDACVWPSEPERTTGAADPTRAPDHLVRHMPGNGLPDCTASSGWV